MILFVCVSMHVCIYDILMHIYFIPFYTGIEIHTKPMPAHELLKKETSSYRIICHFVSVIVLMSYIGNWKKEKKYTQLKYAAFFNN